MKAGCGKTARPVCAADGGQRESNRARLLRPDSWEAGEQSEAIRRGVGGAKGGGQGKYAPAKHALDSEPGSRGTRAGAYTAQRAVTHPRWEKLWGGRRRPWHLHRPYESMEVAPWPKSMISAEA